MSAPRSQLEVVPMFGDMQIAPFAYVKNTPHFDPKLWPLCASATTPSPQSNILDFLPLIREHHTRFISELARHSNEETTSQVISTAESRYNAPARNENRSITISFSGPWTKYLIMYILQYTIFSV